MAKDIRQIEPTAQIRENANVVAQMFKALMDEGFTEDQALRLIGNMFRVNGTSEE